MDNKYWYERIVDTISRMEHNNFNPTAIYITEEVYLGLLEYVPDFILERTFLPDKLMMMNIFIIGDKCKMRIIDGNFANDNTIHHKGATEMI